MLNTWSCEVTWQIEYTFYLPLQNTHEQETRQSGDLKSMTYRSSNENWWNYVSIFTGLWPWQGALELKRQNRHQLLVSLETGWLEWGRYCIWRIKLFSSQVHFIIFCFLAFYLTVFYIIIHVQTFSYWTVHEFQLLSF